MIEKAYIALKRLLVKIWTLEVLLIRSQKEMRNALFTGKWRKGDPCYKEVKNLVESFWYFPVL